MAERHDNVLLSISESPIDPEVARRFATTPESGGVCVFVGSTREWTDGRRTVQLFYEAYEDMALAVMRQLADEALKRWPVGRCAIIHRIGLVGIGEASVIVSVGCVHRRDAFEACRYLIDRLKEDVPVWKREHFSDGTTEWVGGDPSAPDDRS